MKKTFLLTMLCIVSSLSMRAGDYPYLVFTLTDGSTQAITAANLTFTISDGTLTASNDTETLATLNLANLTAMEFSLNGTTGIQTIDSAQWAMDNDVEVYDLNGRQVANCQFSAINTQLPKGVYIVKNGSKTIKVQVR